MKPTIALALTICSIAKAAETPAVSLLILSKAEQTLSIVDPATLKVIAKMPSGPDPHEVIASADGKFAYISNYGGGAYNTITEVDLVAQKTVWAIDLGALRGPHGLMFAGGKVWFTAEAAKAIGSYDPAAKKIDLILGTGQGRTHMIYVFDDGKRMVTSNISSATMTFIEKANPPARGPGPGPLVRPGSRQDRRNPPTGPRPSSPSAAGRKVSTYLRTATSSGLPTPRTGPFRLSISPVKR